MSIRTDIDQAVREQAEAVLRDRAVKQLKNKRDLAAHALVYLMVNTMFVVIWVTTTAHGFFWPVFPMVGWGIGLVMNAWDVYHGEDFSESQVRREMQRLASRG